MTSETSTATVAPFTAREMMAIAAGRFISNGDILFAGTGGAMLAASVAKRIHAVTLNHEGLSSGEIAQLLEAPRSKVSQWLSDYEHFGYEALLVQRETLQLCWRTRKV